MTPRAPRTIRVSSGDIGLAALDYGEPGADARRTTSMLLLHGMRDIAWSMDSIARAFRARYRVVSLELRGHGDSDQPGIYTLPHFVADVRAAARELGLERSIVVGHSLGGQISSHYAALFPEAVAACVLIEGLGPPRREGEDSLTGRRQLARFSVEGLAEATRDPRRMPDLEAAVARIAENHPHLDAERARFLAQHGTRPLAPQAADGGLRWKWDPRVQTTWSSVAREQNEERWGWIECPVLVVTGGRSSEWWTRLRSRPGTAPRGDDIARRLACFRDARHVTIEAAGHMIHFDQPAQLNAEIERFLAEVAV